MEPLTLTADTPISAPADPDFPGARQVNFGGLAIRYDDRILTPRDWTTRQAFWAAELLADTPPGPVIELCAGAGHIGLLTLTLRERRGVLVDVDPIACRYARANTEAAGLSGRVEVREASASEAVEPGERFAFAIVDPPWVTSAEVTRFPEDPLLAIDGGDDGLDVARACLRAVDECLFEDGSALLQLGPGDQVQQLRAWLEQPGAPRLEVAAVREHEDRGVLVHLVRPVVSEKE